MLLVCRIMGVKPGIILHHQMLEGFVLVQLRLFFPLVSRAFTLRQLAASWNCHKDPIQELGVRGSGCQPVLCPLASLLLPDHWH